MNDQLALDEGSTDGMADAALLIDWENIKFSLSNRSMRPSVAAIRDTCSRFGRIVLGRAYADWQHYPLREDPQHLYAAGIEPVYVPTRRYPESDGSQRVKNSVDVRLAADCVELIHTHPGIGVYILATGDSDFIHVVNKLRPYGKRVVGLAVSWSASPRLAELVDELVLYDRDIEAPHDDEARTASASPRSAFVPGTPAAPAAVSTASSASAASAASSVAESEGLTESDSAIVVEAILRILDEYRAADRTLNTAGLALELRKTLGDSDYRMLVRGRLQRIVRELATRGSLQIDQRGVDDWLYLPTESLAPRAAPTPAAALPAPRPAGRGRERWAELDGQLRRWAIEEVLELEADPALDWLTFNTIAGALDRPEEEITGRDLGNAMVDAGLLRQDDERQWYDAFTGRTGSYWTLVLDQDHPEVQAARAASEQKE